MPGTDRASSFPDGEAETGYRWPPHVDDFASPARGGDGPSILDHPDMICGTGATAAPGKVTAPAGSRVEVHWNYFSKDRSHPGPIINYLAACNGPCATVDKTKLEFVKITAEGIISPNFEAHNGRPEWASDVLREKTNLIYSFTVPADFAPGEYVLRHEIIALQFDEKQFYPNCFNLQITGSGTAKPKGTLGTQLYKLTEPGIAPEFNPFQPVDVYPMPGPPLYRNGIFVTDNMDYLDNAAPPPSSPSPPSPPVATPPAVVPTENEPVEEESFEDEPIEAAAVRSSSTLSTATRPSVTAAPAEDSDCILGSTTTVVLTVVCPLTYIIAFSSR